jgi:hypothetical protein
MRNRLCMVSALAVLALAACAPSAQKIGVARAAAYDTDYQLVWNALAATVKRDYPELKVSDPASGVIITTWTPIERVADSQATDWKTPGGTNTDGRILFQLRARIIGKTAPFRIAIDGEAARYRPDYSALMPYEHGAADEPEWVPGRINRVYVGVYEALQQYAIQPGAAPPEQAPAGTPPPSEATMPHQGADSPALPGNDPSPILPAAPTP